MFILLSDLHIKCNKCSRNFLVSKDDVEEFEVVDSFDHGENAMGIELTYESQFSVSCPICGNEIYIRLVGYEYPEGAFDNSESSCEGGSFVQEPSVGILYDSYEFDDSYANEVFDEVKDRLYQIANDKTQLYSLSSRQFEGLVERVFQENGFTTMLTQQTRDGGKDIIATKYEMGSPITFYIECKHYNQNHTVGVELIRALYGVQEAEKVNKSFLVTSSYFSNDAKAFAASQNTRIALIDADQLYDMICRLGQ